MSWSANPASRWLRVRLKIKLVTDRVKLELLAMAISDQLGIGWLVLDEQGLITHSGGDVPDGVISEDGLLSQRVLGLVVKNSGATLGDLIATHRESKSACAEAVTEPVCWDGSDKPIVWSMSPLSTTSGSHSVLVKMEQTPIASCVDDDERDYSDAFHGSPVGMYLATLAGECVEVNSVLASLYGFQSPEKMMEHLNEVSPDLYVNPRRRSEFIEAMQLHGIVRDFQSEIVRADGKVIWVTEFGRTIGEKDGGRRYYEVTVLDISDYKAAERELSTSREQFRRLVETVNIVPWEAEASTGRIRYIGPQAQALLNFAVSDWLEPGFWDSRLHPADREWVRIVRDDAIRSLGQFESEYRLLNAQGETIWVRDIVSVIETADGERILGGFLHNITHRRAAEEALRANQDFIEQIADASPLIWYVLDIETKRIVYLNGGGIRILGFEREDLLKMRENFFLELACPWEISGHQEHFERLAVMGKGEYLEREFRLRTASGGLVWLRTHDAVFKVLENGCVHQVVGTAADITPHRMALENLANSEALFRRLAETTRVIPFELLLTPIHFTYIGPQARELFGFECSEWLNSDFWSRVVHPDDQAGVEESLLGMMVRPDGHDELELRLRDKRGDYHWVRQVLRWEVVDGRQLIGRGYFLDISASKSIEDEREESRRRLREMDLQNQRIREQERLALSREIHDELGQALTMLRLDLSWLGSRISKTMGQSAPSALFTKIQEMEGQIGTTLQIVRKIVTQLRPPILDEFGLAEAIEWQAKDFSRRVGVRCDVSTQISACPCEETSAMIFRIFQELLTNVAKHSKASRVRVSLKQDDGTIYLSVNDNGCGFDPLSEKRKAGYGLLGMRERAEALHGRLEIESAVGEGTTVTLCVFDNYGNAGGP